MFKKFYGNILFHNKRILEKDIILDRHTIVLDKPIKSLGIYHVPIKINAEEKGIKYRYWIIVTKIIK